MYTRFRWRRPIGGGAFLSALDHAELSPNQPEKLVGLIRINREPGFPVCPVHRAILPVYQVRGPLHLVDLIELPKLVQCFR